MTDVVGVEVEAIVALREEYRREIKEFFVRPAWRAAALPLFRQLVAIGGARLVEAQTNDRLLSLMLYDCAVGLGTTISIASILDVVQAFRPARHTDLKVRTTSN